MASGEDTGVSEKLGRVDDGDPEEVYDKEGSIKGEGWLKANDSLVSEFAEAPG